MCEEILLQRYDDTPWGFRLTGGHDFGIPLTVIRVSGGSLAEEAGMCVGDMIIEINGDSTAHITHSEAQQCILEAGNIVTLSVMRGSPVVAVTPTRGLLTPSTIDRATSSIGSVTEYELHSETYRDNVVSAVSHGSGHEMTEEEIAEKLLESAEVIENNGKNVIGVNFKRFVPKCDFIKNSLVFQTLQEEQLFDKKSEEEQLKKSPTKRFSTFMTTPNRPRIKPPEKKKPEEPIKVEVIEPENQQVEESIKPESCEQVCARTVCKLKDIEDYVKPSETEIAADGDDVEHEKELEAESEDLIEFENNEEEEPKSIDQEEKENISTNEELNENTEEVQEPQITETNKEHENKFEKSLLDIQNQLSVIRELPLQIQNHISLLEKQLSDLLSSKTKLTEETEPSEVNETNIDDEVEQNDELIEQESIKDEPQEIYDDDVFETVTEEITIDVQESESNKVLEENFDEENENKESIGRPMYPLTPLPRPIVLPGGRKWRGPKDAYNEKFIAETLISQAEVLVGSTLGVNFRKYIPPKFDVTNSAVYKLVHNIETKTIGGIENRPATVPAADDFYQHKPINDRQRYLASLPQPTIVPDLENQSGY